MFRGSIVALITPFRKGKIDEKAFQDMVEWQIAQGTQGLVPCGTTGESPTLSHKEHMRVVELCVEVANRRVPVIAGTGSNSTHEAIHQTREAERLGADACLLVTPYYNRPTQEGLYRHYKAIAEVTRVPLVLYNVPPRTACDLKPETVARLAEFENIVGIKEACGNPDRVAELKAVVPDDFIILSGEDAQTLHMMTLGAVGTISVTANVVPRLMAEFCSAFLDGDLDKARAIDARLQPLHKFLFVETSPAPVKWALYEMGKIDRGIRLPLVELSEQHRPELRRLLKEVGAL